MADKPYLYTTNFALHVMERLIGAQLNISGSGHECDGPVLFVANHFTRAETFLLPYIIYNATGKYPHSLAHESLFKGALKDYFDHMGVISTGEKERDNIIIGDLITGRNNWQIYPEGSMIKSKQILSRGKFTLTTPGYTGPAKTGAAIIALKTEIYRQRILDAHAKNDQATLDEYLQRFKIVSIDEVSREKTVIVPTTLTYYPLRPGQNIIKKMIGKYFKKIPPRLAEELEIEGNLLMRDTDINIHFADPVSIDDYLDTFYFVSGWLPFMKGIEKKNMLLKRAGTKMTKKFMGDIYRNTRINIDHLVCAVLRHLSKSRLLEDEFYRILYLVIRELKKDARYRLHPHLKKDLSGLLIGEVDPKVESIMQLAEEKKIILRKDGYLLINHLRYNMIHMFHNIRVQNPMVVIANELEPFVKIQRFIRRIANKDSKEIQKKLVTTILENDQELFYKARNLYGAQVQDKEHCKPFFLPGTSETGIVLSHGFLSAPGEVQLLGQFLNSLGHTVYGIRLPGHGTAPPNMKDIHWQDWLDAYKRGYAVIKNCCDQVVFGGFSTGGVLAMLMASTYRPKGVFAINPPWNMKYINAAMAPAVNLWNNLLERWKIKSGQLEYIDKPGTENPEINYTRVYLKGLQQLDHLMDACREHIKDVISPIVIIHSDKDPTVNPKSSKKYFEALSSDQKELIPIDSNQHIIVLNEKRMDVFIQIEKFIRTMEVPLLKADFAEEDSAVLQSEQNELPVNGQGQA